MGGGGERSRASVSQTCSSNEMHDLLLSAAASSVMETIPATQPPQKRFAQTLSKFACRGCVKG